MKNSFLKSILLLISLFTTVLSAQDLSLSLFSSGTLNAPVEMAKAGDNRFFIVEQAGLIKIMKQDGSISSTPFLDIKDRVPFNGSQHGLLGLAFHPNYKSNGYFFVYYIGVGDSTVISRFSVSAADSNLANKDSELRLISYSQPASDHKAGCIKFGPDGYLYIASGDGGKSTNGQYSQNLKSYLGKLLRIDVDTEPYAIPADNPFINDANANDEIWAYGLRNPWKFSFDSETGDLWIGDVGGDRWDDVNYQKANTNGGLNYGWPCYEGNDAHLTSGCDPKSTMEFPLFTHYQAEKSIKVSLHGGFVYRGENCKYNGHYIFTEAYSGEIMSVYNNKGSWDTTSFGIYNNFIVAFEEGYDKELYAISYNFPPYSSSATGVYKITIDEPANGCDDVTALQAASPAGESLAREGVIKLYPNPASNTLQLENLNSVKSISILNATGQLVINLSIQSSSLSVDIAEYPNGLYFLKTDSEVIKFIKE